MDITNPSYTLVVALLVSGGYQDILGFYEDIFESWPDKAAGELLNRAFAAGVKNSDALLAQAALAAGCDMKHSHFGEPMMRALNEINAEELGGLGERFKMLGLNANVRDEQGLSPIHHGARGGDSFFVRALFSIGADAKAVGPNGELPIHIACAEGHDELVRTLLRYWPKANVADSAGQRPLAVAASRGHRKVVKRLLEHWQDAQVAERHPKRKFVLEAMKLARANKHEDTLELLQAYDDIFRYRKRDKVPDAKWQKAFRGLPSRSALQAKREQSLQKRKCNPPHLWNLQ